MRGNVSTRPGGRSARRLAITLFTTVGLMAWGMTPAFAAVTCVATAGTATVTLPTDADEADIVVGDAATAPFTGFEIWVEGAACTTGPITATTTNTDTIAVTADTLVELEDQTVNIDLSGGDFAPGLTSEGADPIISEIEFRVDLGADGVDGDTLNVVASDGGDDAITFGTVSEVVTGAVVTTPAQNFIALNDDDDADVTGPAAAPLNGIAGVENYGPLDGGAGDDWLSAGGGFGTGSAFEWQDMDILGGEGRDTLTGGIGADTLDGEDGSDTVDGGDGDDTLDGGTSGDDTLSFKSVSSGVNVNFDEGEASSADDDDTFANFDNVSGSPFADSILGDDTSNTLKGGKGKDSIRAVGGADTLVGGKGADTLRGGDGDDDLYGKDGKDALNGGSGADLCVGGDGKDTEQSCEL